MAEAPAPPCIWVLAGTNGAGKSSIAGAMVRARGGEYFNPDEAARRVLAANPGATQKDANSVAWHEGRRLLERAIGERLDFTFETTLGGNTIRGLLERAASEGFEVRIWYAGLASPELHLARVRARVGRGGHDIPEAVIRKRYDDGRLHLIQLLPHLTELRVYDNSREADPATGGVPQPVLVLHVNRRRVVHADLKATPQWAKPMVAAALRLTAR